MKRIYWIASYPKSGNTWFRLFLKNYLANGSEPYDINHSMENDVIASHRELFDTITGLESVLMMPEESDRLEPAAFTHLALEAKEDCYVKVHDACWEVSPGMPIVSINGTKGALYILRNPLDVAISFANHMGLTIDEAIKVMGKTNAAVCETEDQFRQKLGSWCSHVASWKDAPWFPVEVLRYEDMKESPIEAFGRAVRFLALPYTEERLRKAIAFSDFKELRKQESEKGFKGKSCHSEAFFRKGEAGQWKEVLTPEQIRRIVKDHGTMMKRFGYLNDIDPEILKGIEP